MPLGGAIEEVARQAGLEPDGVPVADLGVFCLAGADLPPDERRLLAWVRGNGWVRAAVGAQRHVRGPARGDRPPLGRGRRVRLRHELHRRRPRTAVSPGSRRSDPSRATGAAAARSAAWRRGTRSDRRTAAVRRPRCNGWCRSTSACGARASSRRRCTSSGSTSERLAELAPLVFRARRWTATRWRARSSTARRTRS